MGTDSMDMALQPPDAVALLRRLEPTWATGNYGVVDARLTLVSEQLCETLELRAGQAVLDAVAGSGNGALAAARRLAEVTGIDAEPTLLEQARARAAAERLVATFHPGSIEAIPFPDERFDVVLATFRVIFTPDPARAAAEMLRVCRRRGKIGIVSWTPDHFAGAILAATVRYVPTPPGMSSPLRWGDEGWLRALLGDRVEAVQVARRQAVLRDWSPSRYVAFLLTYYGPLRLVFERLDAAGQEGLIADLEAVVHRFNRSGDATMLVPSDYLEAVAVKR